MDITPTVRPHLAPEYQVTHKDLTYQTQLQVVQRYVKVNTVSNPDDFDINLVFTTGVVRRLHSYVFDKVVDMVEDRSDEILHR